jgi:transcription initiation factor IIE alpha subunit
MSTEELHSDMLYHAAISMAKSMLEKGLITEKEYAEIDTILLEKYRPYLGTLLSENA